MDAVRTNRWADARDQVAGAADPVAGKLVTYFRLSAPSGGSATAIAAFVAANPTWPNQTLLERRREEAIAAEPDAAATLAECERGPLQVTAALLRCAETYTAAGRPEPSVRMVRLAWTDGITDTAAETAFLQRWGALITPADQWTRFQTLIWTQPEAAARQLGRLDAEHRAVAQTRIALRHDDPSALQRLAAVPSAMAADPGLLLDQAAWLRRHDRLDEARDLVLARGAAMRDPFKPTAQWSERNLLARRLLRAADDRGAYAVAAAHGETVPAQQVDAEFLAGFIALRRLHDTEAAARHFQTLAAISGAAITQGRAHYWLGRTEAEAGRSPEAEYRRAAAWPVTYYGQLAALALDHDQAALGERIRALRDPAWTREQALALGGGELIRAASLLTAWGDTRRAHTFLLRADEQATTPADRALAAHLANGLTMPDAAVAIARVMGRDGAMLPEAGWPTPVTPPSGALDPAIAFAIMRQESSFDVQAISPSGARGLMQLMPATAQAVSRQIDQPSTLAALTEDPQLNMRLGSTYLAGLLTQFDNALPLAAAAYNAGPNRVTEWLAANGDPRTGSVDMLDWVELIPFNETRNYVQRVMENAVIYRARAGNKAPVLLTGAMR